MSDLIAELESRIEQSDRQRERLMLTAELAWELRIVDADRSIALVEEIVRESDGPDGGTAAAVAEIVRLAMQQTGDACSKILDELANLRDKVAGEPLWAARAENLAGIAERGLGNHPAAMEHHARALEIARQGGDEDGVAYSLHNIGIIHYTLGDYPAALESYERALAIREARDDSMGAAATLNNIAMAYRALGDYPQALLFHRRALSMREQIGDEAGIAASLNN